MTIQVKACAWSCCAVSFFFPFFFLTQLNLPLARSQNVKSSWSFTGGARLRGLRSHHNMVITFLYKVVLTFDTSQIEFREEFFRSSGKRKEGKTKDSYETINTLVSGYFSSYIFISSLFIFRQDLLRALERENEIMTDIRLRVLDNRLICRDTETEWDGKATAMIKDLAKHYVQCKPNELLQRFYMARKSPPANSKMRYKYRCCRFSMKEKWVRPDDM